MEKNYTPGPWHIEEGENWFDIITVQDERVVSVDKEDTQFAIHDAHVIAAAPELLEVIQEALNEADLPEFIVAKFNKVVNKALNK